VTDRDDFRPAVSPPWPAPVATRPQGGVPFARLSRPPAEQAHDGAVLEAAGVRTYEDRMYGSGLTPSRKVCGVPTAFVAKDQLALPLTASVNANAA
jgi:hypothetical protein